MTGTARFWDKRAEKYAAAKISDMAAYEHTLGLTRSHLRPADRALEIGCGTGSTALLLADAVARIDGTDISAEMVRIAAGKAREEGIANAHFRVASAADAVKNAGEYDVVLAFNILHLTPDIEGLFAMLHDRLAPGARFISKTPCVAEPSIGVKRFAFAALIPAMRAVGFAPPVRRLSFAELEEAMNSAGFEIVQTDNRPAMSRYVVARRG